MPKRTDIHRILVIGSGPIVIGQAAEFDYAGTQACLALREEGFEVILVNSNPATIMGRKDIIKIDALIPIDLEVLGYIDPNVTVNVIRDGLRLEKKHLALPERVVNIIRCKNPRCITQIEQDIEHVFVLADRDKGLYRCHYCEVPHKPEERSDF